ncbi:hypothetical protein Tco_1134474 [Tanacetum coccineum]
MQKQHKNIALTTARTMRDLRGNFHITPTSPTEPPHISHVIPGGTRVTARMIVHPQPTLPLGYRAAIARWSAAPLSTLYPPSSSDLLPSSSELPLSSSSSSSSGTSHTSSRPLPRMRYLVSSYSTPSASVGPSHKRCRSPTTSPPPPASAPTVLSFVLADRLPHRKRFRD